MRAVGNTTARSATYNLSMEAGAGISWKICCGKFQVYEWSVVIRTTDGCWSLYSAFSSIPLYLPLISLRTILEMEINDWGDQLWWCKKRKVRKSYRHDFSSAAVVLYKHSAIVSAHYYIYLLLHVGFPRVSNVTEAKGRVFHKSVLPVILSPVRSECHNGQLL